MLKPSSIAKMKASRTKNIQDALKRKVEKDLKNDIILNNG